MDIWHLLRIGSFTHVFALLLLPLSVSSKKKKLLFFPSTTCSRPSTVLSLNTTTTNNKGSNPIQLSPMKYEISLKFFTLFLNSTGVLSFWIFFFFCQIETMDDDWCTGFLGIDQPMYSDTPEIEKWITENPIDFLFFVF